MISAMKLLYVANTLAIHGGIERVLTDKINWLVEYGGYEICLLIVNQGNNPIVFSLNAQVEVHDLGIMFYQLYRYSGVKRYIKLFMFHKHFRRCLSEKIKLFSPDVILFTRLDFVSDVIDVCGKIPVVFESHSSFLAYKYEKNSWLHQIQIMLWHRALKKVQMIVALTNGDASEWKKLNPHVHVIPNVVHLNDTGLYSDCSSKSVIFVGRYSKQKDIGSLLRIWSVVHHRYPDWTLHIYGGYGEDKNTIISDVNLMESTVYVHEPTTDILDKYIESSMLLLTSLYEPFGLVLPEAMSCGIPVVAFDCPYGPSDIISDNVDGFLVKDRNCDSFAEKVCLLIEDVELRKNMGANGIQSSRRFDNTHIIPMWNDLFCKILNH